ncbi:MAG: hypothetical protein KDK30_16825 [Leptospiraceae bacterium]|nr:hypothetical protein [Leptospiraceae bacterium]
MRPLILIRADKFDPLGGAEEMRTPVMIQVARYDRVAPIRQSLDNIRANFGGTVEIQTYPIGHFDIYSGEAFHNSVRDHLGFFSSHLRLRF